jgi:hypothetical protein
VAEIVQREQRAADDAVTELVALKAEHRRVGRRVQRVEDRFFHLLRARRIHREDPVEDRRMRRQAAGALQDLRQRQVIRPDERHPVFERAELAFDLCEPELLELRRADDHHDGSSVRRQAQDALEHPRWDRA